MSIGSWTCTHMRACELPVEVKQVFDEAMDKIVGISYIPVLYVGSKRELGINYLFICKSLSITQPAIEGCKKVIVYKPIDDSAQVLEVTDLI